MRKKLDDKTHQVIFRLNDADHEKLMNRIKESGLNKQTYLACASLSIPIQNINYDELNSSAEVLVKLDNAIRELFLHYVEEDEEEVKKALMEIKDCLEEIWHTLNELLLRKI